MPRASSGAVTAMPAVKTATTTPATARLTDWRANSSRARVVAVEREIRRDPPGEQEHRRRRHAAAPRRLVAGHAERRRGVCRGGHRDSLEVAKVMRLTPGHRRRAAHLGAECLDAVAQTPVG